MARRGGKRIRLGVGLWTDEKGRLSATIKVGSHPQREKYFTATGDRDADLTRMRRWQLQTKATLLEGLPVTIDRETLAGSVPAFLATMPEGSSARRDYEKLLVAWIATPLGPMRRDDIRRSHILTQLAKWESDGYAAATLNHRLRALRKLYDVLDLDDDRAINPCAKVKKRTEPEADVRGADYAILEGILALIPDIGFSATKGTPRPEANKSKIRLRLMAWTGLPPALVKNIREEHIDWRAKELLVTPRRKGKGVRARRLPLLEEAVTALRDLQAAGGFGRYSNAAPWMAWQRAKRRYLDRMRADLTADQFAALEQLVTPLRPYDLRHSFAAMVYQTTENQYAVKDLLMHGSLQTSERYITRAVHAVSTAAIAAVQRGRGPEGASRPSPRVAKSRQNRTVSLSAVHTTKPAKPSISSGKRRDQ